MMARLLLILTLIILSIKSFPQTVSRNVIASGGNSATVSGYTISSTIGQIPFQTLSDNAYYLTQGFEQPGTKLLVNPGEFIQVFPNPVVDYLNLIFSVSVQMDFTISIFNLMGSEMQTTLAPNIQNGVLYTIDFNNFPNGMYLLHIYDKSAEKKLFKVIKIEKFSKANN
jgi:hypothetical protein